MACRWITPSAHKFDSIFLKTILGSALAPSLFVYHFSCVTPTIMTTTMPESLPPRTLTFAPSQSPSTELFLSGLPIWEHANSSPVDTPVWGQLDKENDGNPFYGSHHGYKAKVTLAPIMSSTIALATNESLYTTIALQDASIAAASPGTWWSIAVAIVLVQFLWRFLRDNMKRRGGGEVRKNFNELPCIPIEFWFLAVSLKINEANPTK